MMRSTRNWQIVITGDLRESRGIGAKGRAAWWLKGSHVNCAVGGDAARRLPP